MAVAASGAVPTPSSAATAPAQSSRRAWIPRNVPVNIPALVLVVAGAVVQLIALASSTWFGNPSGRLGFTGMREWSQPGYAQMFFGWIGWLLVAVSGIVGAAACVHWSAAGVFRYLGAVIGVLGAFATVGAVLLLAYQTHDDSFHVARNYSAGPYLAVLGLLACALGAAAGTGRRG